MMTVTMNPGYESLGIYELLPSLSFVYENEQLNTAFVGVKDGDPTFGRAGPVSNQTDPLF